MGFGTDLGAKTALNLPDWISIHPRDREHLQVISKINADSISHFVQSSWKNAKDRQHPPHYIL
jgi:hypothetical protein